MRSSAFGNIRPVRSREAPTSDRRANCSEMHLNPREIYREDRWFEKGVKEAIYIKL